MTNADNSTDKYCTKTKTLWSERHRESQIICHIIRHTMWPVVTVQALPKMPFGTRSQVGPRNHVLGGDPNPPGRRNNFWRGHLPAIVKYREYLTWVKVIRYVAAVMQPITISTAVNDEYHADVAHMDYKECTEPHTIINSSSLLIRLKWDRKIKTAWVPTPKPSNTIFWHFYISQVKMTKSPWTTTLVRWCFHEQSKFSYVIQTTTTGTCWIGQLWKMW